MERGRLSLMTLLLGRRCRRDCRLALALRSGRASKGTTSCDVDLGNQ